MNPIALYLASGESLYPGAILLFFILFLPRFKNPWIARLRNLLIWSALALMAMACPPFPFWLDAAFILCFMTWLVALSGPQNPPKWRVHLRLASTILLGILLVLLPALEIPHRFRPAFIGPRSDHLVVIGDSLSAGIGSEKPWPKVLQQNIGIPVTNLSVAGAETSDALDMCRKLTDDDHLVLIEIGGNDLIAGVPSAEFERRLSALFAAIDKPGRTIIMFEIPLLPHRIAYGQIQRRLAAEHHVQLIPKRFLIQILAGPDATSDGLHLAPAGASRMAELVASLLDPLLKLRAEARGSAPAP